MRLETIGAGTLLAISSLMPVTYSTWAVPASQEMKATAAVTNHNPLDVDVFVLAGGTKFRLGTVVTSQSQEFDLPAQAVNAGPVRVSADAIGARVAYTSDPVSVADGDRVNLTVSPQLPQSTLTVERGGGR